MFYLLYDGKYVCSATLFHTDKRAAIAFRNYQSAVQYREHLQQHYKITGVRMVTR
jgi:hypothetical protein